MQPDALDENAAQVISAQMNRAEQEYLDSLAVNLDEVIDETITVAIRVRGVEGAKPTWRHVELDPFVPMSIFDYMMAGREKVVRQNKLREQAQANNGEVNDEDPSMQWMKGCVLRVWQETEPKMDMDALLYGLGFKKIKALFYRFFGDALSLNTPKVGNGSNTSNGSASSVDAAAQ